MSETLIERLRIRAKIRRSITTRKSVQEGSNDRISDLLEEAANEIERLEFLMCEMVKSESVDSLFTNTIDDK